MQGWLREVWQGQGKSQEVQGSLVLQKRWPESSGRGLDDDFQVEAFVCQVWSFSVPVHGWLRRRWRPLDSAGGGGGGGGGGFQNNPRTTSERTQTNPIITSERTQNDPKTTPEQPQNNPRTTSEQPQNNPRISSEHSQNVPIRIPMNHLMCSETAKRSILGSRNGY